MLAFVAGLVILQLLTLIPIAGAIIGFAATVFGPGVVLLAIIRARSQRAQCKFHCTEQGLRAPPRARC